ncbi:DUF86 domain-containing protein [Parabacteroides acidifaciens]|uniref:DUF86 domain-containing protein n=1 Tax=Parabacteroides acidifaciens TaxID=2290935 RepID=A0A3D8HCL3_9BACT|nr:MULTISPECIES: HepT-like ribonuclease domain-containing protein [Parabacteroides]MBC8603001.1 DUF86 domain-containing protein [Parabacteroides acidifaciens]RDU48267.1 DUF86 domain-containing protein [Parabacteroides acidifaciens]RHO68324.1 DUF86 domain-containing protein [Parabacteroides sp. AF48-14]
MAYTFDKDLAVDTLELIKETLLTVMRRTSHINTVDDFYASEVGMILLDSVCMKLVAVGESVKNLDKITNKSLLENYPEINWKDIMGMRDIIVHHYFDIDATIVVATLRNEIPQLYRVIELIIEDLI